MDTMTTILEMRNIRKTFPGVVALDQVDLRVQAGQIHALVGENGAGKSTLMKVLSGVYPHGSYSGEILFEGAGQQFGGIHDSEKLGIIIIHQELALVPLLSITENIFMGNEIARGGVIDWFAAHAKTRALLAKVTVAMADAMLAGKPPEVNDTTTYNNGVKVVPSYLLKPVSVDITNWKPVLVDSGYYKESQVK